MRTRVLLGAIGIAMIGYGTWRIFANARATQPLHLGEWLLGALVVHDGVIAFVIVAVGWVLVRAVPGRARAYVQGGLITAGLVTAIAVVETYRRGKSAPGQALLEQNYRANLVVLLVLICLGTLLCYMVRVVRDARSTRRHQDPPDAG
jgi:hypothetical protein